MRDLRMGNGNRFRFIIVVLGVLLWGAAGALAPGSAVADLDDALERPMDARDTLPNVGSGDDAQASYTERPGSWIPGEKFWPPRVADWEPLHRCGFVGYPNARKKTERPWRDGWVARVRGAPLEAPMMDYSWTPAVSLRAAAAVDFDYKGGNRTVGTAVHQPYFLYWSSTEVGTAATVDANVENEDWRVRQLVVKDYAGPPARTSVYGDVDWSRLAGLPANTAVDLSKSEIEFRVPARPLQGIWVADVVPEGKGATGKENAEVMLAWRLQPMTRLDLMRDANGIPEPNPNGELQWAPQEIAFCGYQLLFWHENLHRDGNEWSENVAVPARPLAQRWYDFRTQHGVIRGKTDSKNQAFTSYRPEDLLVDLDADFELPINCQRSAFDSNVLLSLGGPPGSNVRPGMKASLDRHLENCPLAWSPVLSEPYFPLSADQHQWLRAAEVKGSAWTESAPQSMGPTFARHFVRYASPLRRHTGRWHVCVRGIGLLAVDAGGTFPNLSRTGTTLRNFGLMQRTGAYVHSVSGSQYISRVHANTLTVSPSYAESDPDDTDLHPVADEWVGVVSECQELRLGVDEVILPESSDWAIEYPQLWFQRVETGMGFKVRTERDIFIGSPGESDDDDVGSPREAVNEVLSRLPHLSGMTARSSLPGYWWPRPDHLDLTGRARLAGENSENWAAVRQHKFRARPRAMLHALPTVGLGGDAAGTTERTWVIEGGTAGETPAVGGKPGADVTVRWTPYPLPEMATHPGGSVHRLLPGWYNIGAVLEWALQNAPAHDPNDDAKGWDREPRYFKDTGSRGKEAVTAYTAVMDAAAPMPGKLRRGRGGGPQTANLSRRKDGLEGEIGDTGRFLGVSEVLVPGAEIMEYCYVFQCGDTQVGVWLTHEWLAPGWMLGNCRVAGVTDSDKLAKLENYWSENDGWLTPQTNRRCGG